MKENREEDLKGALILSPFFLLEKVPREPPTCRPNHLRSMLGFWEPPPSPGKEEGKSGFQK